MKSTLWYPKFQNPRIQASFDFWEKNFQPHQNFKPIKKFFCTFFTQCCLNLRSSLKHIKVQENLKTQKLFTFSLFHFHFFHNCLWGVVTRTSLRTTRLGTFRALAQNVQDQALLVALEHFIMETPLKMNPNKSFEKVKI